MNVIIYNINSFGGNYEYSKYLFNAYSNNPDVRHATLLMPSNAEIENKNVLKKLYSDAPASSNKLLRKIHFLYRSFLNPFRLYKYLRKEPSSIVLFNDYDQLTALFWAPFFRLLRTKHRFAVILHDPDRDRFFFAKFLSVWTMRNVMSFMDIAFYHGYLPKKKYYEEKSLKVSVPHGIYNNVETDEIFFKNLKSKANGDHLIGILGNVRHEKNYEIIMDALLELPHTKLLIAGAAANSSVSVDYYKDYAIKKGVQDKVLWETGYLPNAQFNAAIGACDVVLLYYKPSFTSQSGVLNAIAPFGKKLVISDAESSLKDCVTKYQLGEVVPNNDVCALSQAIRRFSAVDDKRSNIGWEKYIEDSSWDKHVSIAVEQYKKLLDVL